MVPNITLLKNIVNDPATQTIGVLQEWDGIQTLLSGDEFKVTTVIGNTLPQLYSERNSVALSNITIVPAKDSSDTLISLLILVIPPGSLLYSLSYLLPSSATFYGLMNLLGKQIRGLGMNILILLVHCIIWLLLFYALEHFKKKKLLQ